MPNITRAYEVRMPRDRILREARVSKMAMTGPGGFISAPRAKDIKVNVGRGLLERGLPGIGSRLLASTGRIWGNTKGLLSEGRSGASQLGRLVMGLKEQAPFVPVISVILASAVMSMGGGDGHSALMPVALGSLGSVGSWFRGLFKDKSVETAPVAKVSEKAPAKSSAFIPPETPDDLNEPVIPEKTAALKLFSDSNLLNHHVFVREDGSLADWLSLIKQARERGIKLTDAARLMTRRVVVTRADIMRRWNFATPSVFLEGRNIAAGLPSVNPERTLERLFGTAQGEGQSARRLGLFYKEALSGIGHEVDRYLKNIKAGRYETSEDREAVAALALAIEMLRDESPVEDEEITGITFDPDRRGGKMLRLYIDEPLNRVTETINTFLAGMTPLPEDVATASDLRAILGEIRTDPELQGIFPDRGTVIRRGDCYVDFDRERENRPTDLYRLHRGLRKALWGAGEPFSSAFKWELPNEAMTRVMMEMPANAAHVDYAPPKEGRGAVLQLAFGFHRYVGGVSLATMEHDHATRIFLTDAGDKLAAKVKVIDPDKGKNIRGLYPLTKEEAGEELKGLLSRVSLLFTKPIEVTSIEIKKKD